LKHVRRALLHEEPYSDKLDDYFVEHVTIDLDQLISIFTEWLNQNEGLLMQNEETGKYFGFRAAKRGNGVYQWRLEQRLLPLYRVLLSNIKLFEREGQKTNMLYFVLTYNTNRGSLIKAWERRGREYNLWITRMRKQYGRIEVMKTYETFESGYPHINVIAIFRDTKFTVFQHKSRRMEGKQLIEKLTWRIEEKREMEKYFHSNIDVQAVQTPKQAISYILKYITKELHATTREPKHNLTLALMWLFRARAFSISQRFIEQLGLLLGSRLESSLHISNRKFRFWGVFAWADLQKLAESDNPDLWTYRLKRPPDSIKNLMEWKYARMHELLELNPDTELYAEKVAMIASAISTKNGMQIVRGKC
jgi:hypothetical protein